MEYNQDMNLVSASGYCMPFEERNGNVNLTVPYGQQPHPQTGEDWFHHGVDFATNKYLLAAVADGIVSGIGVDREEHGMFIVIKYGKYEVTYSGLSNLYAQFGHKVKAGTCVAQSSDVLHLGVRFDNQEMDPMDFITMLFGNVKMWSQRDVPQPEIAFTEMELFTDYEKEKDEIEQLMLRYYANYMSDMHNGIYLVPQRTGESMRNILSFGAMKHYFYETMPSMLNPLGLGNKSIPLVTKAQNLLISDFLNYLALRHHIYLSTMDALSKKKAPTASQEDLEALLS